MKYFTKYLPVEGEIKKDDLFSVNNRSPVPAIINIGETSSNIKKVKLHLCSRDIQVGDEVINTTGGKSIVTKQNKLAILSSGLHFKVIGEILTPNIKEGQEFTEREIKFLTIGENIS